MGSTADSIHGNLNILLEEAHGRYALRNVLSQQSHEEATKYMPGGNTRTVLHTTPFPLTVVSGKSCYLNTIDGHEYIDFLGEYTAGIYGHNHPVIRASMEQALDGGWNYGAHNPMEQKLAKLVCNRFPPIELVRFVNSGTEANMMAIATAMAFTGKRKILLFDKGYHGSTINGQAHRDGPSINLPHDFVVGKYNDVEDTKNLLSSLPSDSLAAILVEPMLGSGGCYPGSTQFLNLLRQAATEHKALLIFDEVMTSRLYYHGYNSHVAVTPDLMTLGKWIGGGMSFGAFGGRKDIMKLYDPRLGQLEHPGTFNNNVFSMSAGVAGCTLLDEGTIEKLNSLGDNMRQSIEKLLKSYGISGSVPNLPVSDSLHKMDHDLKIPKAYVKGCGSMMCLHFAGPNRQMLQGLLFHHMLEHGIYIAQRGFIALNIMLTEQHVAAFMTALDQFCKNVQDYLK